VVAPAQEVLVVSEANAVADAGPNLVALQLTVLDPAANGLLVGANAPGDVGDGQHLAGVLTDGACATILATTDGSHWCIARR
jgi:hypothetical protein